FTIQSVVGNVAALAATDSLVSEFDKAITVEPVVIDPTFQAVGSQSIPVTFTNNGFNDTGRPGDTITRNDGGHFIADGYVVHSPLRVAGSINATAPSASYRVAAVSLDGKTLTLVPNNILTTQGTPLSPVTVTLTRGVAPHIESIVIDQRDDLNVTATGVVYA